MSAGFLGKKSSIAITITIISITTTTSTITIIITIIIIILILLLLLLIIIITITIIIVIVSLIITTNIESPPDRRHWPQAITIPMAQRGLRVGCYVLQHGLQFLYI